MIISLPLIQLLLSVFAHLCSQPGVVRRDVELFSRALMEADEDEVRSYHLLLVMVIAYRSFSVALLSCETGLLCSTERLLQEEGRSESRNRRQRNKVPQSKFSSDQRCYQTNFPWAYIVERGCFRRGIPYIEQVTEVRLSYNQRNSGEDVSCVACVNQVLESRLSFSQRSFDEDVWCVS